MPEGAPSGLADVLAYLEQREENARAVAGKSPEFEDVARGWARQVRIIIDDLKAGMHVGAAETRAGLLAARNSR